MVLQYVLMNAQRLRYGVSQRVVLPSVTFDLADVSGIYDYGCYVAVVLSSPDQPAELILTGADAAAFRASEIGSTSLLDDFARALGKSGLFADIQLTIADTPDCTIVGHCRMKTPTTLPVYAAGALPWAWVDVPLVCGDGSSTCDLSARSDRVELTFRMAHGDGGQVRGRIEVTGFATQSYPTNNAPPTVQSATWQDDDPFA